MPYRPGAVRRRSGGKEMERVLKIFIERREMIRKMRKIVFDISRSLAYHLLFWLFLGPRVR